MNCRLVTPKMRRVGSAVLKGRRMNEESKLWEIWHWYIKGEYHCDKCPYSWEERGEEDADAGCLLSKDGELRDTCRYIRNPISRMIVNGKINDRDREYDGWKDYIEQYEICKQIITETKKKIENGEWVHDNIRRFYEGHEHDAIDIMMDMVEKYKAKVYPHRTPKEKLKDAFREWKKEFAWKHFKRYLRKRKKK